MTVIDLVLVISHLFLMVDLVLDWASFRRCIRPVHYWLLVSYALMLWSRLAYLIGTWYAGADSGNFLLNARQKNGTSQLFFRLLWGIIVPTSALWNLVGTVWLYEVRKSTPDCLAAGSNHLWIMIVWQVLGYVWIIVHCKIGCVAWLLERRLRTTEDGLRQVADEEALTRWGLAAGQVQDYTALRGLAPSTGLTPAEIHALPCDTFAGSSLECAICLGSMDAGECVRKLEACGHVFHRACIDLWLFRSDACPLCKCSQKCSGRPKTPATMLASAEEATATSIRFRHGAAIATEPMETVGVLV